MTLTSEQTNYLANVLRLGEGARVLAFNGRDGEFAASLARLSRKGASLIVGKRTRPQEAPPDVDFLFAPLKHARLDYVAQKAVEMGARRLRPIVTRRTQVSRLNRERLLANAIEACEQCGVIWTPEVVALEPLEQTLAEWPVERLLVFCDEEAPQASPIDALSRRESKQWRRRHDRARRRFRRGRADCDPGCSWRHTAQSRAQSVARGYRGGRRAGADPGDARRLAETAAWFTVDKFSRSPPCCRHDVDPFRHAEAKRVPDAAKDRSIDDGRPRVVDDRVDSLFHRGGERRQSSASSRGRPAPGAM